MFEAVHASPDGESTIPQLVVTAAECGFRGVVIRNHHDSPPTSSGDDLLEGFDVMDSILPKDFDIVAGIELRGADISQLSGFLGHYRPETTIVLIHGGSNAVNRFAVRQERVDVLAHPMRGDSDIDHVLARTAAENDVRLEVSLAGVLRESGGKRVRVMQNLRKLGKLIQQYDVPYVVSGDPSSHLEIRGPRELAAVGSVIGFDTEWIEDGLGEWGRLAQRNRERLGESLIEPGVFRGSNEAEKQR